MNKKRAELHIHTNMTAMDGINTAKEYIEKAVANKLSAIAITDRASVQAFAEAYAAWERIDKKIKLIYGAELCVGNEGFHISILAKNKNGLKNLYKLISVANEKGFVLKSEIEKHKEGLLIGSGADEGELFHAIKNKPFNALCAIAQFYDYLEIVPGEKKELIQLNKKIVEIGDKISKPVVAVSDADCISSHDATSREILMGERSGGSSKKFKATDELLEEFSYLGKEKAYETVVLNTCLVSDLIDETFSPFERYAHYEADTKELEKLACKKAVEKYGESLHPEIQKRLDWELSVICKNNLSAYNFMLGYELCKNAKKQGWTVGVRGSVASSLVAYFLGITRINPLNAHYYCPLCHKIEFHNDYNCGVDMEDKTCQCGEKFKKDGFTIPPESLFGTDGSKVVDIDYNLAPSYQKQAFLELEKLLNATVVRVGSIKTISYHTAQTKVKAYCEGKNIVLTKSEEDEFIDKITRVKEIDSINPGRVVVVPCGKEIYDYTPVEYKESEGEKWDVTHFNYNFNSSAGYSFCDILINIDVLSHPDPVIIKKLEELTNVKADSIPLDDKKTMELFKKGETMGIREFSAPFVREQIIPKVAPKTFDDLIRISAISHGNGTWVNNGDCLIEKGKSISQLATCRDDVMLDLLKGGMERNVAYHLSERIRKGKGFTEEQYDELIAMGFEKWKLDSWKKILYSFPRAHAASYVLYAYWMAYYKAHYPTEFDCVCR